MKTDIGNGLALYPTPIVVLGAIVDGKPNWMQAAHVGIVATSRLLVSCAKAHHTAKGLVKGAAVSVSMVDRETLPQADYVGSVSGNDVDKSGVYSWSAAPNGAPVPEEAPLTIVCRIDDIYETPGFESFICKIAATYAEESVLTEDGKINYRVLKPVLFEMPTYEYLKTGEVLGKCMKLSEG